MKFIVKGRQPPALIAIHKDKTKKYEIDVSNDKAQNITIYSDTLKNLMTEQGFICCYCMQRIQINPTNSKLNPTIEHYIPRKPNGYKILVETKKLYYVQKGKQYSNMLATCHGNDKIDPENKHCDSSRGNAFFKYLNPLEKSCEKVLGYGDDGSIICLDDTHRIDIESDIEDLLNLNFQKIKDNRKSVIDGVKKAKEFFRNKLQGKWNKAEFKREQLAKCVKSSSGEYEPYIQVKIYVLSKL